MKVRLLLTSVILVILAAGLSKKSSPEPDVSKLTLNLQGILENSAEDEIHRSLFG